MGRVRVGCRPPKTPFARPPHPASSKKHQPPQARQQACQNQRQERSGRADFLACGNNFFAGQHRAHQILAVRLRCRAVCLFACLDGTAATPGRRRCDCCRSTTQPKIPAANSARLNGVLWVRNRAYPQTKLNSLIVGGTRAYAGAAKNNNAYKKPCVLQLITMWARVSSTCPVRSAAQARR